METDAYLARIGIAGPIELTVDGLERLQRAHLTHAPFENLDVFHRRGVNTDPITAVSKIVERERGGWCYELNGAFATLLTSLGFSVRWLGATVLPETTPGPDHLAIEVRLDRPYLVDVGFGDSFIRPLPLDAEGPHDGGTGSYTFEFDGDTTTLLAVESATSDPQYAFSSGSFTSADFDASSHRLQTDTALKWTQAPFATRLLDGGPDRVTLLHDRIKFRRRDQWTEEPVSESEWPDALETWFGMAP